MNLLSYQTEISTAFSLAVTAALAALAIRGKWPIAGWVATLLAAAASYAGSSALIPHLHAKNEGFPNKSTYFEAQKKGYNSYDVYKEHLDCLEKQEANIAFNEKEEWRKEEIKKAKSSVINSRSLVCYNFRDMIKASAMSRYNSMALQYRMPYSCEYLPTDIEFNHHEPTQYPEIIHVFTELGDFYTLINSISYGLTEEGKRHLEKQGIDYRTPVKLRPVNKDSCENQRSEPSIKAGNGVIKQEIKGPQKSQLDSKSQNTSMPFLHSFSTIEEFENKISSLQANCSSKSCLNLYDIWKRETDYYYSALKRDNIAPTIYKIEASQNGWIETRNATFEAITSLVNEKYGDRQGTLWLDIAGKEIRDAKAEVEKQRALILKSWLNIDKPENLSRKPASLTSKAYKEPQHLEDYASVNDFEIAHSQYFTLCSKKTSTPKCLDIYDIWDRELNFYYSKLRSTLPPQVFNKIKASQRLSLKNKQFDFDALDAITKTKQNARNYIHKKAGIIRARTLLFYSWLKIYNKQDG